MESLALNSIYALPSVYANAYLVNSVVSKDSLGLVLDIGGLHTVICKTLNGFPLDTLYFRNGGVDFTNAIVNDFSLSFEEAEKLKKEYGNLNIQVAENIEIYESSRTRAVISERKLSESLKKKFEEWNSIFNRTCKDSSLELANHLIVVIGGNSELSGFAVALGSNSINKTVKYQIPYFGLRDNSYCTCLGILKYYFEKGGEL
jgi:cell division ATPase FtsA